MSRNAKTLLLLEEHYTMLKSSSVLTGSNLRRCYSKKPLRIRTSRPFWVSAGCAVFASAMSYWLLRQDRTSELSPTSFTSYRISYKKDIDPSHFIMELTPLQQQKVNMWSTMRSERLWSVEVKQPEIMVARSYTPLPLQVQKQTEQLKLIPDGQNAGGKFLLYLKQYDNGEVARWLHGLPEGHIVEIRGPFVEYELPIYEGEVSRTRDFFFKDDVKVEDKFKYKPIDIAMFTAGTGIVSALQMLLTEMPFKGKMQLCYSCGSIEELGPLKPFLFQLQRHGRIDLHIFESLKQPDATKRLKDILQIISTPTHYSGPLPFDSADNSFNPVLSLVCGPDRYLTSLAGPRINLAQGPIGGLLQSKGWNNENVYKLS